MDSSVVFKEPGSRIEYPASRPIQHLESSIQCIASRSVAKIPPVFSGISSIKHLGSSIQYVSSIKDQETSIQNMLARQMQKIEELTLYVIELKKENEALKTRVLKLEKDQ